MNMKIFYIVTVVTVVLFGSANCLVNGTDDEDEARTLLKTLNHDFGLQLNTFLDLLWKYETNNSLQNLYNMQNNANPVFEFDDEDLPWNNFTDTDIVRQATFFGIYKKTTTLPLEYFKELDTTLSEMLTAFYNISLCNYQNQTFCGPDVVDLDNVFSSSSDADELLYYWKSFADNVGQTILPKFKTYIELANAPSKMDGYPSKAEEWMSEFEQPIEDVEKMFTGVVDTLTPLYQELHAYVRSKLNKVYGDAVVPKKGAIPAHVLGTKEASDWQGIYKKVIPYPDAKPSDINDILNTKNLTAMNLFKLVEKNFKDIGMKKMTDTFWQKSLIEQPSDREVSCDSSAWNFFDGDDFRIQECTEADVGSIVTTYNLMTLIEIFMSYKDQPVIYQATPIAGFNDAIITAVRRSVKSNKHFNNIGLLDKVALPDKEQEINDLLNVALYYVPNIVYTYTLDKYRRRLFRGEIASDNLNTAFWDMRQNITGVVAPIPRTDENLDAALDSTVVSDDNNNFEFTRMVLSFQLHRALCKAAGVTDPLHECDSMTSTKTGETLTNLMKLGRSEAWFTVLDGAIGEKSFDASAIVDYFKPLTTFLQAENKKAGATVGW